ncbi:MAG: helix-turn-helix domain-containing protein [Lachnospiraceae bacterium]|jgi:Sugar diacid utilization regulator|nr:helix-turn-helix domain-containing protein [uncultured Oribacterium sp.]MBF0982728.1 helix-turn-helix domain-containing protein [Lachnospiraceae bacterium]
MISNQVLQSTIDSIKGIARLDVAIADIDGKVLATTFLEDKELSNMVVSFAESQADSQAAGGYQFFKIFDEHQLEFVLIAHGDSDDVYMVGKLAVLQIQTLLVAYREKFDKDNFVKNLLLDNLLLVDIYNRAKKLHIEVGVRRVVFLIESNETIDVQAQDALKEFFSSESNDFVTAVDEKNIIVVKELQAEDGYEEVQKIAASMLDMLSSEVMLSTRVAYGTIVNEIKEVSRSYKEAKMALEVGKIFFVDRKIVAYNALGIGRLIYQLPIPLCKMFIKEIFVDVSPDDFDEETLETISKFFENNLNVSETSRQLFIHRNTLVYRLDKLDRATGLDLRVFDDAITFQIALMVVKYMKYMEKLDF